MIDILILLVIFIAIILIIIFIAMLVDGTIRFLPLSKRRYMVRWKRGYWHVYKNRYVYWKRLKEAYDEKEAEKLIQGDKLKTVKYYD